MSMLLASVLSIALIVIEDVMLLILANGFFERKRNAVFDLISFLILSGLTCLVVFFLGSSILLKYGAAFVFMSLWVLLCYKVTWVKCVFPAAFLLAYLTIVDNAAISLICAIVGTDAQQLFGTPDSYYIISFSVKILELLGIVILYTWLKRNFFRGYSAFLGWLRVLVFPVSTLIVSILLLKLYYLDPNMSSELVLCNAIILAVDVSSVFFLNYIEKQQSAIRDNIILRQSMKVELDSVEAWHNAYDAQRKRTHDFQNQLMVIRGLVSRDAPPDEVLGYIEELQGGVSSASAIKTHRTVVDVILSQKCAIAEGRGIAFNTQLDDLSDFPLRDDELVVVLSNLIDNAIEACCKIADAGARVITLKMKVEPKAAFLYIENATAAPVIIRGGRIASTKANAAEHGYGLQNIMSVLERSGAIYYMEYDDKTRIFFFSVQIPKG